MFDKFPFLRAISIPKIVRFHEKRTTKSELRIYHLSLSFKGFSLQEEVSHLVMCVLAFTAIGDTCLSTACLFYRFLLLISICLALLGVFMFYLVYFVMFRL